MTITQFYPFFVLNFIVNCIKNSFVRCIMYCFRYIFFYRFPKLPELILQMNDLEFLEIALEKKADKVTDEDIECYKYWFGKQSKYFTHIT